MIYTVDEVSDLLSIPRPTLYRYLREYSIPHLRRSGKISIPEESFGRIREARELHKDGLGTETVRRRLREGGDLGAEELAERLDQLSEGLESLQAMQAADEMSYPHETLQTLLERQDALISAVSDLTRMVENLIAMQARPPKSAFDSLEEATPSEKTYLGQVERMPEVTETAEREPDVHSYATTASATTGRVVSADPVGRAAANPITMLVGNEPATKLFSRPTEVLRATSQREKFGILARRRRRSVLALVLAILAGAAIAWGLLAYGGEEIEEPSTDEQSAEEGSQSVPAAEEVTQSVKVPYLVGLTLQQTEEKLAEAGLKLGELNETPMYETPAGEVVAQDPQVSVEVEQGTVVNVVISSGAPTYPPQAQADGTVGGGGGEQYPAGVPWYPGGEVQNPAAAGPIQAAPSTAAPVQAAQAG